MGETYPSGKYFTNNSIANPLHPFITAGSNLVYALNDNSYSNTILTSVNLKGEVQAQKNFVGSFMFVLPVAADGMLQVFGWGPGDHDLKVYSDYA